MLPLAARRRPCRVTTPRMMIKMWICLYLLLCKRGRRVVAMSRACAIALAVLPCLVLLPTLADGEALDALEGLIPESLLGNVEDLMRAASVACDILPLDLLFSRQHTAELAQFELLEVTRAARRTHRVTRAHLALRHWHSSALTLYIPGWWNTPTDEAAQGLASALLKEQPVVLILDTRPSFCRGYLSAASRVNSVSHLLYYFIKNLTKYGFRPSSIHLIGFSLGAHVAGMTGKLVQRGLKTKLGRITALDPARPCFRRSEFRLQKTDASFVQVVHSSAGILGVEEPVGHADVYVNGVAVKQPECQHRSISFECDHNQSWRLYASSIGNRRSMVGRQCHSWEEVTGGKCSGDNTVLGYGCSNHSRGMFLYKSRD